MQSAKVLAFPGTPTPPDPPIVGRSRGIGELDFASVAHELGVAHRPIRSITAHIRALIRKSGFPPPKNKRIVRGHPLSGADAVCRDSVWPMVDVLRWLDNDSPPPVAAARKVERMAVTRADLARRAQALVAIA